MNIMEQIRAVTDPSLLTEQADNDDLIIIMRPVKNALGTVNSYETHTITAHDFCVSIMIPALSNLARMLPRENPGDGVSLWLDNGIMRLASGDPADVGTMSPSAMHQSINNLLPMLPKSPPPNGGLWIDNGVLVMSPPKKNNNKG